MNTTMIETSIKHGRTMYIMGLEHAVNMLEIADSLDVIVELKAKLEREKTELENMEHSRFNAEHYSNCDRCYEDHLDFVEQSRIDEQEENSRGDDED